MCLLFVGILLGLPAQRVRVFSQVQVSMIAIGEHVICCGHLGWGYNVKSLPIISPIDPGGSEIHHKCHKKVILAMVAPNGWISMDLDWIWAGYIQDGLFFLENIYWTNSQAQVN